MRPSLILRDEMPPIIMRVCTELREQLQTQIETNLFQTTCQRVENAP
jgi:hypothetical protein